MSTVKGVCLNCFAQCGAVYHVEDGKLVKVEGDKENRISRGSFCAKGRSAPEAAYSPDRLLHPLKRVGERGEGKWQQISWDEALTTITTKINEFKEKYGAESIIGGQGAFGLMQGSVQALNSFWQSLGTPNRFALTHI